MVCFARGGLDNFSLVRVGESVISSRYRRLAHSLYCLSFSHCCVQSDNVLPILIAEWDILSLNFSPALLPEPLIFSQPDKLRVPQAHWVSTLQTRSAQRGRASGLYSSSSPLSLAPIWFSSSLEGWQRGRYPSLTLESSYIIGSALIALSSHSLDHELGERLLVIRKEERVIVMVERYRSHLIFVKGYIDSAHHIWKASLHVQFNEDTQTFRDVYLPPPTGRFAGKTSAEKNGIKEAKKWVDNRLRKSTSVL